MRTVSRLAFTILTLAAVALGLRFGSAQAVGRVAIRPQLLVFEAGPGQLQMARWAARRFEIAELQVPEGEVHFHHDLSACDGHLGWANNGRIDLCASLVDAPTRRALLHEMGHIWLDENITTSERTRFLELRDLSSWNSPNDPWSLRGYEQGAEIIAWALGERILTPSIPDNEPEKLELGFQMLTGIELPEALRPEAMSSAPAPGSKAILRGGRYGIRTR